MPSGGRRPGAGRKPKPKLTAGQALKKMRPTRLITRPSKTVIVQLDPRALSSTIEPRQVMLNVMRHHYERAEHAEAIRAAIAVAPYVHPRLSSIEVSPMDPTGKVPGLVDLSKADNLEIVRRLAFMFYLAGKQAAPTAPAAPAKAQGG